MMNTFDKLVPLLSNLGSARRSPAAGPSDIVSPNPIDRVPYTTPQGPDVAPQSQEVAPGPSSASSERRASCSGLQKQRKDKFASPRGQPNEGDQSRGSRHASPSHQDRLRCQLDDVHRQLDYTKEIIDLYRAQGRVPPDQARYDLEISQAQYAQLSIALEESLASTSFHRHGPSPTSHGVASPDVEPRGPHSATLRGSPCPDRPISPSHDRSRTRDAYSSHHRFSSRSLERYDQRVAYSNASAHRRRPRSRESPPSRHLDFTSKSPSPHHSSSRERFASDVPFQRRSTSRRSSSPTQRRVTSRRSPSPTQRRIASRRSPSPTQKRVASRRTQSPTQRRVALRRTPSPYGGPRRLLRSVSPHGGPRRLLRGASPPRGHPLLSEWHSLQAQDLALPGDPFLGILVLQDAPPGTPSLQREVPLHLNDDVMRRETQSPLHISTHHEPRLESPHKRDPIHGLLLLALLPLREKRRKLMRSPYQLQSRPWWIS